MSSVSDLLKSAAAAAIEGRLRDAAALLRQVVVEAPDHAGALAQLGVVSFQLGDADTAETMLRRAVAASPENEYFWNNLGVVLEAKGAHAPAAESYARAIQINPQRAALHFNLANARRSMGRCAEAEASFRRCIALDAQHAHARHNLGALLKENGDRVAAERLFRETIALEPGMVDAHVNLGSALQALGRDEEALACYRDALRVSPGYGDALAGEVSVLDRLGRVDEACERIRPLLETAPDNADVITTFASLARRLGAQEPAVTALEGLLARTDLLASKREAALFALGKLCDELGRFPEAFEHYRAANALRPHPFDVAEFRDFCSRMQTTFAKGLFHRLPHAGNESELPIFIVGMPRSGTSLAEQILSSHPEVFGAGELSWIEDLSNRLAQRLGSDVSYPECALDLSVRSLSTVADEYLAMLSGLAPQASRVVDKMPGNFTHLGLIELLFPRARVIHISRDPLDNCLSCYFQNFTQGHHYTSELGTLGAVYAEYRRLMEHWRSMLSLPILEVRYEELVENQEAESRRLVEFCGLPWDSRCLRFHETRRVVRTASYDQVRRPMYRDSLARHRHYRDFIAPLRTALAGDR